MPQTTAMRKSTPTATPYAEEAGMECTPGGCAKACGACLVFMISLVGVAALGVIAGGAYWTAQSMYRVTDNEHSIKVRFCTCNPDTNALMGGAKAAALAGTPPRDSLGVGRFLGVGLLNPAGLEWDTEFALQRPGGFPKCPSCA